MGHGAASELAKKRIAAAGLETDAHNSTRAENFRKSCPPKAKGPVTIWYRMTNQSSFRSSGGSPRHTLSQSLRTPLESHVHHDSPLNPGSEWAVPRRHRRPKIPAVHRRNWYSSGHRGSVSVASGLSAVAGKSERKAPSPWPRRTLCQHGRRAFRETDEAPQSSIGNPPQACRTHIQSGSSDPSRDPQPKPSRQTQRNKLTTRTPADRPRQRPESLERHNQTGADLRPARIAGFQVGCPSLTKPR